MPDTETSDQFNTTARTAAVRQFGRYRILRELGRGAMGVVHLAEDPALGRQVAIKTIALPSDAKERAEYEARFMQEARAAGGLNHPNIITIHDVGRENDVAFMAMEKLDGVELGKLMSQRRLPLAIMLDIGAQIADGLAFAHQAGVIHRDIKPANIMLVRGTQVKIMDFGIARMRQSQVKTQTGLMMGSPKYMSPEQVNGTPIDHRSDIFTLGVLLYEMATGLAPFGGADFIQLVSHIAGAPHKPLNRVIPGLPERLTVIVDKALEKDPLARYQDAAQLAADLRALKTQVELAEAGGSRTGPVPTAMDNAERTMRLTGTQTRAPASTDTGRIQTLGNAPEHTGMERALRTQRNQRGLPATDHFELPHEREQRLALEALQEPETEPAPETGWIWSARYAIGIVGGIVLGWVLGDVDLFRRTQLTQYDLSAAEIARFLGYATSLSMLGMGALKVADRLREDNDGESRLADVLVPLAALIIVALGYRVTLIVATPILSNRARGNLDWLFVAAIAGAVLWLGYVLFAHSDKIAAQLRDRIKLIRTSRKANTSAKNMARTTTQKRPSGNARTQGSTTTRRKV